MTQRTIKLLKAANVPAKISEHLFGKGHTDYHKISVGVLVMFAGVLVMRQQIFIDGFLHIAADVIGGGIHGIGLTPIIEWAVRQVE